MKITSLFSTLRWALSGLLLLAMLAAVMPRPAQAAAPAEVNATCDETYTVKENDSIYKVANKYGISAYRLARANNMDRPWTVTLGQKLCIPGEPTVNTKIKWTAKFSSGQLTLTGSGFAKQYVYFIKVRENDSGAWYKLGHTQTARDGDLSVKFKMPKDLLKVPSVIVCLKDVTTDALLCKQVYRQ